MNSLSEKLLEKLGGKLRTPTMFDLPVVEKVDTRMVTSILSSYDYEIGKKYASMIETIGDDWMTKSGKFTKRLQKAIPEIATLTRTTNKDCTDEVRKEFDKLIATAQAEGRTEVYPIEIALILDKVSVRGWNYDLYCKGITITKEQWYKYTLIPAVNRLVYDLSIIGLFDRLHTAWMGDFTKKIPTLVCGEIGERITREAYLGGKRSWCLSLTDSIYWDDDTFGKNNSCWWGCYSDSKDVFIDNGGLGLLWHDDINDNKHGTARVWIAPLYDRRGDALFLFNQYGKANDKPIRLEDTARFIVSLLGSDEYHWLPGRLVNDNNDNIPYINDSGNGLFICSVNSRYSREYTFHVEWGDYNTTRCELCGHHVDEDDQYTSPSGDILCQDCFYDNYFHCDGCGEATSNDDSNVAPSGEYYCDYCFNRRFHRCTECGEAMYRSDSLEFDGEYYCERCFCDKFSSCEHCEEYFNNDDLTYIEGHGTYCHDCECDLFTDCAECGAAIEKQADRTVQVGDLYYCDTCAPETEAEIEIEISDICHAVEVISVTV